MSRLRALSRSPFGSALLGGLVVALFGWVAIAAGWVEADGDSTSAAVSAPVAATSPAPIADGDGGDGDGKTVNEIYRRDGQGVGFIEAEQAAPESSPFEPFGTPRERGTASGSGFVIDREGHLVTNSHVVEGATAIRVKLGSSETTHSAEIVGTDPATDLALLKVDAPAKQLHPLGLGDSSEVEVGDPVVAIGNPFGLDRTVTTGIVSALQRQIQAPNGFSISHVIQTDAAINPGNSGGPLIDAAGNVIGVNSQIQSSSGGNVGIGFAIPINTVREVVAQLEEDGEVEHAFLGISGGTITPELARALNLPVKRGVLIQEATPGGPADDAGIEGGTTSATIDGTEFRLGGDIITEIDGKRIGSADDVIDLVNGAKPGDLVDITVQRGKETETVKVTLGERPASASAR